MVIWYIRKVQQVHFLTDYKAKLQSKRSRCDHLYMEIYEPKTFSTGVFLHEYFKSELNTLNYLHPLVQKGAKNTINIANQRFLESYVAIPSNANELLAISKLLCSLNTKLEFLQNILKQSQGQSSIYFVRCSYKHLTKQVLLLQIIVYQSILFC